MSDAAAANLRQCQVQLDMDGIQVGVSRQALDEVLDEREELIRDRTRLEWMVNHEAQIDVSDGDTWIVRCTHGTSTKYTINDEIRVVADEWREAIDEAMQTAQQDGEDGE
ncbi:MAG: hypothetical protein AAGI72_15280 [Pseudomonadota bacterium]